MVKILLSLSLGKKPSSFIDIDGCLCLVVNKNRKQTIGGGGFCTGLVTKDISGILYQGRERETMMTKNSFRYSSLVQSWPSLMNIGLTLKGSAAEI